MNLHKKRFWVIVALTSILLAALLLAVTFIRRNNEALGQRHSAVSFVMDTVVEQSAYGPKAEAAMEEVSAALMDFERRLSLFDLGSEIAAVNAGAGGPVEVSAHTADLLVRSLELSTASEGSFAISIAPLTLAWGITGDVPRVVPPEEIAALLPLVKEDAVLVESRNGVCTVTLQEGMALDLGGIAKGEACRVAMEIYERHGVDSALISIGGNVYARGAKPDGTPWRVGLRMPAQGSVEYIASFALTDTVMAVSGGYERFFEKDGVEYIHIIDPRTGAPAVSDIVEVGVVHPDGAAADFYSTSLFVLGRERTLEYMENGMTCMLLDEDGNLYVSESLRDSFELFQPTAHLYNLIFVAGG